jgi:hypothetical protein
MIAERILRQSEAFLGQVEVEGNKGFKDAKFEALMKSVGWKQGDAWCSYFCELVWKQAYGVKSPYWKMIDKLFTPSATATFANFSGSATFKTGKVPQPGALVVWQYGSGWKGHIGICMNKVEKNGYFDTIEGNTNKAGEREGMYVLRKKRALYNPYKANGLNLLGFIYPTE